MNIRLASINDIEGIARVHLESWKTSYKGIISDDFLSNITMEGRIRNWTWNFNNQKKDERTFVLEDKLGHIVGFINGGICREPDLDFSAELYAIYLLEETQGMGFGRLLFNNLVEALKLMKYDSLMLWVLEENPSIHFYKNLGGEIITKKEIKIGEDKLIEIALGWKDI
jgi:ribosomal protein S18 acetylase RimI-like enzyme